MIEKIRNIFAIPELRRKILFTLGILVIVRLGSQVPIPGINPDALRQTMESLNDTFFGLFNLFTGGAFGQAAIFGLGIMPYISVSIVIQILQTTLPYFPRLAMEGESGRAKITQITRYGTVLLATIQGYGLSVGLESSANLVINPGIFFKISTVSTIVAGTMFLMWLGEQITQRGIGNGISLIIFSGIIISGSFIGLSKTYPDLVPNRIDTWSNRIENFINPSLDNDSNYQINR